MQVLYLIPVFSSIKKEVQQKNRELRKVVKEKLKISWFMCTSAESFSYQVSNQFAIFVWCKFWLGLIATLASQSYSLFLSNPKFLCACV